MHNRFISYNKSLLVNAFMSNEYREFRYIRKINTKEYRSSELQYFCITNKINMARLYLSNPLVDINFKNNVGNTALHIACMYDIANIEIVKLLLNHHNIDVNIKDNDGKTALDYVKERDRNPIINSELLANILPENNIFQFMTARNTKELINLLESYGAK